MTEEPKITRHTPAEYKRMKKIIDRMPKCQRLGVIPSDDGLAYVALFKSETSTKPEALVEIEVLMDFIDHLVAMSEANTQEM